ncbi:MurR/RpiR family transcriptional regulator [Gracilibacillus caseinilyticus]|uniref:MurR/RpiR family transcriptional regulator n=1 Tax=Gracilibacillus caseinilyticus TaxID=2932256 RepID=A0ABY4EWZ1_9BACI|nr:MurR/RpiR family transcriptional regulator [Gracilibacillus caseinilyticus]UOQ46691.1 MurR/RpiR family transcriptional regulator [Gracilibacillus caseinilyticus]
MVPLQVDKANLTQNQIKIANYISKHLQQVLLSTEKEIASEIGISIASVSRFWPVIGYQNLKAFKQQMKKELEVSPARKIRGIQPNPAQQKTYLTMEKSISLLQETFDNLHPAKFQQAIDCLFRAKKVYVLATGPSKGLGELFVYRIKRFGITIQLIEHHGNEILEDLLHLTNQDVVVLFAFGRLLPEEKIVLEYQRDIHYQTIMITDQLIADFTSLATITLFASRGDTNEFHSMVAPTLLIENMILGLSMKEKEQNIERLERLSALRKKYEKDLPR